MEVVSYILIGLVVVGVAIAFYEWRKKSVLLRHDLNLAEHRQNEAERELSRNTAGVRDRTMFDHSE
jgi:hypothetical protein